MTAHLYLGSDRSLRGCLFSAESFAHPAKLHLGFLRWLGNEYTTPGQHVADPMGGVGSAFLLALEQRDVTVLDVEPRWLALAHDNAARIHRAAGLFAGRMAVIQHDARQPWPVRPDVALFSPPYACRAGTNAATRRSVFNRRAKLLNSGVLSNRWKELVVKIDAQPGALGAELFHYGAHPDQIGHLRSGRYWDAMGEVYRRAHEALPVGGLMILVIKDHIRDGRRVHVCDETVARVTGLGFDLAARHARHLEQLSLWQRRRREQGLLVVEEEEALVFRRAA